MLVVGESLSRLDPPNKKSAMVRVDLKKKKAEEHHSSGIGAKFRA